MTRTRLARTALTAAVLLLTAPAAACDSGTDDAAVDAARSSANASLSSSIDSRLDLAFARESRSSPSAAAAASPTAARSSGRESWPASYASHFARRSSACGCGRVTRLPELAQDAVQDAAVLVVLDLVRCVEAQAGVELDRVGSVA